MSGECFASRAARSLSGAMQWRARLAVAVLACAGLASCRSPRGGDAIGERSLEPARPGTVTTVAEPANPLLPDGVETPDEVEVVPSTSPVTPLHSAPSALAEGSVPPTAESTPEGAETREIDAAGGSEPVPGESIASADTPREPSEASRPDALVGDDVHREEGAAGAVGEESVPALEPAPENEEPIFAAAGEIAAVATGAANAIAQAMRELAGEEESPAAGSELASPEDGDPSVRGMDVATLEPIVPSGEAPRDTGDVARRSDEESEEIEGLVALLEDEIATPATSAPETMETAESPGVSSAPVGSSEKLDAAEVPAILRTSELEGMTPAAATLRTTDDRSATAVDRASSASSSATSPDVGPTVSAPVLDVAKIEPPSTRSTPPSEDRPEATSTRTTLDDTPETDPDTSVTSPSDSSFAWLWWVGGAVVFLAIVFLGQRARAHPGDARHD